MDEISPAWLLKKFRIRLPAIRIEDYDMVVPCKKREGTIIPGKKTFNSCCCLAGMHDLFVIYLGNGF